MKGKHTTALIAAVCAGRFGLAKINCCRVCHYLGSQEVLRVRRPAATPDVISPGFCFSASPSDPFRRGRRSFSVSGAK